MTPPDVQLRKRKPSEDKPPALRGRREHAADSRLPGPGGYRAPSPDPGRLSRSAPRLPYQGPRTPPEAGIPGPEVGAEAQTGEQTGAPGSPSARVLFPGNSAHPTLPPPGPRGPPARATPSLPRPCHVCAPPPAFSFPLPSGSAAGGETQPGAPRGVHFLGRPPRLPVPRAA